MPLPTSADFSIFDWNPDGTAISDGVDGIFTYAFSTFRTIPSPGYLFTDGSGNIVLFSNDGIATDLNVDQSIGDSFTLEADFRFQPGQLPANLSSPSTYRSYISVSDDQGNSAGVLLSAEGIAVVSQPGNTVIPFSQSAELIPKDGVNLITVRLSVDGRQDTVSIYITYTSSLSDTGHVLRYVLQAPASTTGIDRATLEVLGTAAHPSSLVVRSFRLGSGIVEPSRRPIADAGYDQVQPMGGTVRLDGTESYDPDGSYLTYEWTVTGTPSGVTVDDINLSGGVSASMTQDNLVVPPNDGITISARRTGNTGNSITITLVDPGVPASALSLSVSSYDITVNLQTDAASALITTYKQLVDAITLPSAAGYNENAAALLTAALANSGAGGDVVQAQVQTYLSGGLDSIESSPTFNPTVPGSYQFQLIVNDGFLDSLPASVLVLIQNALQPLDYIPNADYIWDGLPDFWKLVPDKSVFSTFWSSAIQVISGEVLKAWQTDYAKSLNDIQRFFIRKWLKYSPYLEDIGTVTFPAFDISGSAVGEEDGDGDLTTSMIRSSGVNDLYPFNVGDLLLDTTNGTAYEVSRKESNNRLVVTTDTVPIYDVIDSDNYNSGYAKTKTIPEVTTDLWALSAGIYDTDPIVAGDILRITTESTTHAALIKNDSFYQLVFRAKKPGLYGHQITVELVVGSALSVSVLNRSIKITYIPDVTLMDDIVTAVNSHPKALLLVTAGRGIGGGAVSCRAEDAFSKTALCGISNISSGGITTKVLTLDSAIPGGPVLEIALPVVDKSWQVIRPSASFSWRNAPYITSLLNLEDDELVQAGDLVRFSVRSTSTGTSQDVHCEVLGVIDYRAAFDSTNLLAVLSSLTSTEYTYTYSGIVRIHQIPTDDDLDSVPKLKFPIAAPTSKLYENQHYTVGSGAISFASGTFSSSSLPPDNLWGEVSYFNNEERIEGNFGRLAGLTRDTLSDSTSGVDYLSAVQALWFAFFGGPKISNIRLGAQIFFGLPFSEKAGVITEINNQYSLTHGRILIQDNENTAILRSYRYPLAVGVATNPATSSAYVAGDVVEQFAPLSNGVTVEDYVNTPRWFLIHVDQGLMTEVEKFFLFRVQVDTAAAVDTTNFSFVATFVNRLKPVYTSPILSALLTLDDDYIQVGDDDYKDGTLFLYDNPRGAPDQPSGGAPLDQVGHPTACMLDAYDGNGSWTGTAVDLEFSLDRTSPKIDFVIGPLADNLTVAWIDSNYIDTSVYSYVVIEGTLNDDGVYDLMTSVNTQINISLLDGLGAPVALTIGDTGKCFTLQGPHVVFEGGDGVNKSFKYLDDGVRQPKYTIDGGIVPYTHTVNQRIRINMDYDIGFGAPQLGPRVDQGLILDDFLTMEINLTPVEAGGIRQPNMHSTTIPGNGLHWWLDGGAAAVLGVPEEVFYEDFQIDAMSNIRPAGASVSSGYILRVVGHKGLSKPPSDPDMIIDHLITS